jgi:energy-coupling factor transporter ATP-binding protein EcfA2
MSRIPIVLIAGFLGAGKTTFLHALMGVLKERKVGFSVVVNDFENAEIDAARLRDLDVEVQSINGSCVCCSSLNDFMLTLGTIDVPRGGVLLVEANGASDFITHLAHAGDHDRHRALAETPQAQQAGAGAGENRHALDAHAHRRRQKSAPRWHPRRREDAHPSRHRDQRG